MTPARELYSPYAKSLGLLQESKGSVQPRDNLLSLHFKNSKHILILALFIYDLL